MAGGLTHTAAAKHTVIRRFSDKGQQTVFGYVDLRKAYLQTMSSTAITSSVCIPGRL